MGGRLSSCQCFAKPHGRWPSPGLSREWERRFAAADPSLRSSVPLQPACRPFTSFRSTSFHSFRRPAPRSGRTLIRAYPACAPVPARARFAAARIARLIARARPRASEPGRRTHLSRQLLTGFFAPAPARKTKRLPDAASSRPSIDHDSLLSSYRRYISDIVNKTRLPMLPFRRQRPFPESGSPGNRRRTRRGNEPVKRRRLGQFRSWRASIRMNRLAAVGRPLTSYPVRRPGPRAGPTVSTWREGRKMAPEQGRDDSCASVRTATRSVSAPNARSARKHKKRTFRSQ